jgi:hypothetical protein
LSVECRIVGLSNQSTFGKEDNSKRRCCNEICYVKADPIGAFLDVGTN